MQARVKATRHYRNSQDGSFRGVFLGIALERPLLGDFANKQARLSRLHFLHKILIITNRVAGTIMEFHQLVRGRGKADGVVHVEEVAETDVALAGGIQLCHGFNTEAFLEFLPDGRAKGDVSWRYVVLSHTVTRQG